MRKYTLFLLLVLGSFSIAPIYGQNITPVEKPIEKPATPIHNPNIPPGFLEEIEKNNQQQDTHFMREFFNMLFILGAMVAVLMLLTWFMKRMVSGRLTQLNVASPVKILERRALSNKTTIYIIEIAGKVVALAESHNGVTLLTEVPREILSEHPSFSKMLGDRK